MGINWNNSIGKRTSSSPNQRDVPSSDTTFIGMSREKYLEYLRRGMSEYKRKKREEGGF